MGISDMPKQPGKLAFRPRENSRASTIANGSILTIWTRLRSSIRGSLARLKCQLSGLFGYNILFLSMFALFLGTLARIDRIFFKRNHDFCILFLYSSLPNQPEWDLPPLLPEEESALDKILKQKFCYLGKGTHCYAFLSEDQKYVIKFHRFPSHMRIFPWLTHPLSYQFSKHRKKIKDYNMKKLYYNLENYKNSYRDLKEESGLILLHINKTDSLHRRVTLVDRTKAEYQVSLDQVTFILQHKADLIYPTLDRLIKEDKIDEAKKVVSNIIHLIATSNQKEYIDNDPVLHRNYGLLSDYRAIHIDIGDLIKKKGGTLRENDIPHVKEMTESLRKRLENTYPQLLEHYHQEINSL
jgi:hypothetical protein